MQLKATGFNALIIRSIRQSNLDMLLLEVFQVVDSTRRFSTFCTSYSRHTTALMLELDLRRHQKRFSKSRPKYTFFGPKYSPSPKGPNGRNLISIGQIHFEISLLEVFHVTNIQRRFSTFSTLSSRHTTVLMLELDVRRHLVRFLKSRPKYTFSGPKFSASPKGPNGPKPIAIRS